MASTLTSILLHCVFSTKNRRDLITPEIAPQLYNYRAGIIANQDSRLLAAGGTPNHVHLLAFLSKKLTVVDLMEDVKKDSSKWTKTQGTEFADFYWQVGYGAFSIGQSGVPALRAYFARQKEHHKHVSFETEFVKLLEKYQISYDLRYLWD